MGAARRAATKTARGKAKKKPARSGDPRRAAEIARGSGVAAAQEPGAKGGANPAGAAGPAGLGGLGGFGGLPGGGLPEGFPDSLADGLANLPPGLNFPPPQQQGNVPAAFRGANPKRRKKK
jgi:hypothetical protein